MKSTIRSHRRRARLAGGVLAALAAGVIVPGSALGAGVVQGVKSGTAPGIVGDAPGFPVQNGAIGVYEPGDADPVPDAFREVGQVNFALSGGTLDGAALNGPAKLWAVTDILWHTHLGSSAEYLVQVPGEAAFDAEFDAATTAKLTWLLQNADGLIASSSDQNVRAAAIQIVVWSLSNLNPVAGFPSRVRFPDPLPASGIGPGPTDNVAVNKDADAIRAMLATAAMGPSKLTAITPVGDGCKATLTITGTPFLPVTVTMPGKTVTVQLDSAGTASVPFTGPAGTAVVNFSAQATTGGSVVRLDPKSAEDGDLKNSQTPEEFVLLGGATTTTVSTSLTQCPPGSPNDPKNPPSNPPATGLGTPPPGTTTGKTAVSGATTKTPRARLQVTKVGPKAAVAGQLVKYRITVKNASRLTARAVTLRDVLPSGLTVASKVKGASLKNGSLRWSLGTLAPGRSKTFQVQVRIARSVSGRRCNTALASARGVATVRSLACTRIAAVAGAVDPAVTG